VLTRLLMPVVLLVTLTLAGCGSGSGPTKQADPPPAPSPSSTPTSKPTEPPGVDAAPPPRPGDLTDSDQSAVAYAGWFAQLIQYALEARDFHVVSAEAQDQAACSGCRSLTKFVTQLKKTGYWQVSEALDLGVLKATRKGDVVRVQGTFTYPRVQDLRLNGKVARTIGAKPYTYFVDLTWDRPHGAWRVRDYQFQERGRYAG
jgi:hypothetical protein